LKSLAPFSGYSRRNLDAFNDILRGGFGTPGGDGGEARRLTPKQFDLAL